MNNLITPSWVVNESGQRFMNSVKGIPNFNRSLDETFRGVDGAKIGYTVQYRLPNRGPVRRGQAWQPQTLVDATTPVTLSYQSGYDFDWSSASGTQEVDLVRERYVNPAADAIASDADSQSMTDVYRFVYNMVGTLGTTPSARLTFLQAVVKILDGSGPSENIKAVLDTLAAANIADTTMSMFNPPGAISENYRSRRLGAGQLGISEWFQDQNIPKHTSGTFTASTPTVNGAGQTGSSLVTQAWASGATSLKAGDIFTIANVLSINYLSYQSTGRLQQFSVQADVSDTAGAITFTISPSIITSGALQTVNSSPANSAAITVWSANPAGGTLATTVSPQSLVFNPDFACFVMADLADPVGGAKASFARSKDFGISIRFAQQWLIGTDQNGSRLDALFGANILQARLACRVPG